MNERVMAMQMKWLLIYGLASAGLLACQDKIVLDHAAPFGSKVVRLWDVEVATVDGTAIYLSDVEQMARTQGKLSDTQMIDPNSPLFKSILRELVDQRVLGLAAITQSLDQTQAAKRRQAIALEQLYGRLVIEAALDETVTDSAVRRLFEEQQALNDRGPERRARLILVATQEEADAVLTRLDEGEDFGVLAGILSIDEATRNKNGDLGYFSQQVLDQKIAKTVFQTPLKQRAPVFETEAGFHIIEVMSQRSVSQRSFEEMETELREFLTYEAINTTIRDLRARSDIRLNVVAPLDRPPSIHTGDVDILETESQAQDKTDVENAPDNENENHTDN